MVLWTRSTHRRRVGDGLLLRGASVGFDRLPRVVELVSSVVGRSLVSGLLCAGGGVVVVDDVVVVADDRLMFLSEPV